jgi:hypothetical protein
MTATACLLPLSASANPAAYADNARSTSKDNATVRNVLNEFERLLAVK